MVSSFVKSIFALLMTDRISSQAKEKQARNFYDFPLRNVLLPYPDISFSFL